MKVKIEFTFIFLCKNVNFYKLLYIINTKLKNEDMLNSVRILEDINDILVNLGYKFISEDDTFASHGIDSLDFNDIIIRLEERYNIEFDDKMLDVMYADKTVKEFIEYIKTKFN